MIESALRLGLTLGLAHASDADHVCTIASLLRSERGVRDALKTSLVWGLGHSATFFGVGLLLVAAGLHLPGWMAPLAETLVAASLVWLGVNQWRHAACPAVREPRHDGRTFALGLVHGLAGSAGVGLLALSTMEGRARALAFLVLYGAGVVLGMAAVTLALALPLGAAARRSTTWRTGVLRVAATLSVCAGLWLGGRLVVSP
ncbi:MAG: HupE/UreJ family protein [Myxococcaceae bacterium]|jgi:nickel/cobalt exporter|nr:HupE/UreJ family protein [Myxococcaceae bacterium]MCA3012072.1 HupE/UreJ family protein [Myxococcaceae bacterium]